MQTLGCEYALPQSLQEEMRKLRLWHWKQAAHFRKKADDERLVAWDTGNPNHRAAAIASDDGRANFHIKQVQLLNSFFPLGDYAMYDESAEKVSSSASHTF